MSPHPLQQRIQAADTAINQRHFDELMDFYTDDAVLVVRPGLHATGKEAIMKAFHAIDAYFNQQWQVQQEQMYMVENQDTALVLAHARLFIGPPSQQQVIDRKATYLFRKEGDGQWRCVLDNSYGTDLVQVAPTLHLLCGKIASGKSTLAQRLAQAEHHVLISEDEWLATLYPGEIHTLEDYVRCSQRLRQLLGGHISTLLKQGLSVVLDYPANTRKTRQWLKQLLQESGARHQLHYLEVPDTLCKQRLQQRNQQGEHRFITSEETFDAITHYFEPPAPDEGFELVQYPSDNSL